MSDFYNDDGWEAVVSTPRMGGGKPMMERYAIALRDRDAAQMKIAEIIEVGSTIISMYQVKPSIMQTHALFPGKWTKLPVYDG